MRKRKQTIAEFLREHLSGYGERARFSKELGVSASTVSKWINGDVEPDFENCLRIAEYFEIEPLRVFEMAQKPQYIRLFDRFFPESSWLQEVFSRDPSHLEVHRRLARLLRSGLEREVNFQIALVERELETR